MTSTRFKDWMKQSTIHEKRLLAQKAETSLSLLYQLSYGTRHASAELAGRIEKAIALVNKAARHAPLPDVTRSDLSDACAKCPYYKRGR